MPRYLLHNPNKGAGDKFTFGKTIGQPGATGYACLATMDSKTGPVDCAVKIIRKDKLASRTDPKMMVKCLNREIEIMQKAKHKHVIKFLDAWEDSENIYIAMEACTGGELFDKIQLYFKRYGGFTEKVAARILRELFEGLLYLHKELKVAHCDLKPDNFLFKDSSEQSPICIIDFGASKVVEQAKMLESFCGTIYYIAPEVWKGSYTNACDIWSMGVITYILLFGRPPFSDPRQSQSRIKRKILNGFEPIEKPGKGAHFPSGSGRSTAAMDFISKCLITDSAKRMTAEEALLHPWLRGDEASDKKMDEMIMESIKNFSAENRFKKAILEELVDELDDNDTKLLQEQFKKLDTDGDAKISLKELGKMFGCVKAASKLMGSLDIDGDGEVAVDEFRLAFLNRKISSQQDRLYKLFNKMDLDGNGLIDKREINKALKGKMEKKEIDALIKLVDKDGNKKLNFAEFLSAWNVAETERVLKEQGITKERRKKCSIM
mmetsp:Transcript_1527/g.3486  ORF Transcript_1527/g.3486 Transcript_1527/m.3486 type:complete len:491 (+) Transcript_1527:154-1626(+)